MKIKNEVINFREIIQKVYNRDQKFKTFFYANFTN